MLLRFTSLIKAVLLRVKLDEGPGLSTKPELSTDDVESLPMSTLVELNRMGSVRLMEPGKRLPEDPGPVDSTLLGAELAKSNSYRL